MRGTQSQIHCHGTKTTCNRPQLRTNRETRFKKGRTNSFLERPDFPFKLGIMRESIGQRGGGNPSHLLGSGFEFICCIRHKSDRFGADSTSDKLPKRNNNRISRSVIPRKRSEQTGVLVSQAQDNIRLVRSIRIVWRSKHMYVICGNDFTEL